MVLYFLKMITLIFIRQELVHALFKLMAESRGMCFEGMANWARSEIKACHKVGVTNYDKATADFLMQD